MQGESMLPGLDAGDHLLVAGFLPPRAGDVVAVADPRDPDRIMVKRVATVDAAGVTVLGDNPSASTDSRTFGPVPVGLVLGRAFYRYWPESKRGPVRRVGTL